MKIIIEHIENPDQEFWIWKKEITNEHKGRVYPTTTSNVNSGKSVAIYQIEDTNIKTQIAQLILPDYKRLREYYSTGKKVNLDYTYIDDFTWLGDKVPYEVEMLPYTEREEFCARCSFWKNTNRLDKELNFVQIMKSQIINGYVDFSYSGFYDINLNLSNLKIESGNLRFDYARFYHSYISLALIECNGDQFFHPEISFSEIIAEDSNINTRLMAQLLTINFYGAKTRNTTIRLQVLPVEALRELILINATINKVSVLNAKIETLRAWDATISSLEFIRCTFLGSSKISGNINLLYFDNCINSNVFEILSPLLVELSFFHTINNGRFFFPYIKLNMPAILKALQCEQFDDIQQLLMLKENFRQNGEYEKEDVCHLYYQRLKTKREKNLFKKMGGIFLDIISGYGTKPSRTAFLILFTIFFFGSIYYFVPFFCYSGASTWLEHFYVSGITFFAVGYGDIFPLNNITKIVSLLEAFFGVTITSYFLVLLSRKIIR